MRRSQGPPGSNRIFVCSGSDELLIQAVARFRSTCNQAEATASIWLLRNVSLPILSAHTAAVCGSVAAIFFENAVTATSRDSLCGSVPSHAPAASVNIDLLIRTGGERRLSDLPLWEAAHAELYFTDRMWPDFDASDLALALDDFRRRERRFGRIPELAAT